MSILGYSTSYFLPEYWGSTPLYGEKIIPLLDYILSTEYTQADGLANAFYDMANKYKNTPTLPIEAIEEIIDESGYGYVRALLGNDEDSIRLLVYLLVLIHQLKGTKIGIEVVLNLLRKTNNDMVFLVIGNPDINYDTKEVTNFSTSDYIQYNNFTVDQSPFEITLKIRTPDSLSTEQCILSSNDYGLYIGISSDSTLVLSLGSDRTSWNIVNSDLSTVVLEPSTSYYLKLVYDGSSYTLKLSTDGVRYRDAIIVSSTVSLDIHGGRLYMGVDNSEGTPKNSFNGSIDLLPVSLDIKNSEITQWFEQFPVITEDEDTFIIKTNIDITKLNVDFFSKFVNFINRYVYPTLKALEVKFDFENNLTFIPYVRQKIRYVTSCEYGYKWSAPELVSELEGVSDWKTFTQDFKVLETTNKDYLYLLSTGGYLSEANVTDGLWTSASFAGIGGAWSSSASSETHVVFLNGFGYASVDLHNSIWILPIVTGKGWTNITYGDSIWVALRQDGKVSYSNSEVPMNSEDWSALVSIPYDDLFAGVSWQALAYGNGKFVALGNDSSALSTSEDGIIWTETVSPWLDSSERVCGVAYGNGIFIALCVYGKFAISTDGVHWTTPVRSENLYSVCAESGSSVQWRDIIFVRDKFWALSNKGHIAVYEYGVIN